ncbi:Csu type fimbrial protein [Yersinia pekkanenii]|uniref:Spore coat U domain-containing protein n=1 Tax=Yersinia pekkanenii TaxID=1288385 RepID=A0A0T9QGB6_9GAMM|nr:spore coat U domain-containing protein [Yersinia pekkanenii]CNI09650.1 spore coat U domain-containing protein [Yersinia pekkanenii]CRY68000.1 spore coat U domain-containing protein [Yersinia pekkanenii]
MKKTLLIIGAMTVLQVAPVANAGTATGAIAATLIITTGCYVNDGTSTGNMSNLGTINFGSVSDLTAPRNVTFSGTTDGSLSLYCSNNTPYTISIDNGLHNNSGQRRLTGGTSAFVNYNLYKDSAMAQPWDSTPTTGTQSGTGAGLSTAIPLIIYAQVPIQTTPLVGTYTDTVTVAVTW